MIEQWMPWLLILVGLILLILGGELLVRGASTMAAIWNVPPLVIGLTVVAFGTSAPELVVSLQAAFSGVADVAVGNVVGSNIFNILFVLGLSSLITPLIVSSQLIRLDLPLMVIISLLVWLLAMDGTVGRIDGGILFGILIIYLAFCLRIARKQSPGELEEFATDKVTKANLGRVLLVQIVFVVVGLAMLGLGSRWLVDGAVTIATRLGVSELVIGLTIVAIGTSLPEVVTSVVASVRGQRDIAVGNVVGSNIFNICCVLGLSSLIAPHGIPVSLQTIRTDLPVMIVVAVACLPVFFTGYRIARWEGACFLIAFVAYNVWLLR